MLNPPILFGHRGARGHAQENTVESFELALRLGATGIETDAWMTQDGHVVLDHDGEVGSRFRRRHNSAVAARDLPSHIPSLEDLCRVGRQAHLSIDVKDVGAFFKICEILQTQGVDPNRTWLCHPDLDIVSGWRSLTKFKLVHSTRYAKVSPQFETHAALLAQRKIDVVNMPAAEWTGGLIALYHRFSIACFAWNVQYTEVGRPLVTSGIDALYGDFVDRLVDAVIP